MNKKLVIILILIVSFSISKYNELNSSIPERIQTVNANRSQPVQSAQTNNSSEANTLQIPSGREFEIDIPGIKERVLLFGRTTVYYLKSKVSELKGSAYVKSKNYEIFAERLLYYENFPQRKNEDGEKDEHGRAWGNVRIFEKEKKVEIFGNAAVYYPQKKYMLVTGNAKMIDPKEGIIVSGQTMERYTDSEILIVTGNGTLYKKKDGLNISAARIWYNGKTKKLVMRGNVKITEEKNREKRNIEGDEVVFTENERERKESMIVTGNSVIREFEKGQITRTITADKIDYSGKKDSTGKKTHEYTLLTGQVNMTTKNEMVLAGKVEMKKTPDIDHWELTERVYIRDLKTKDEIRGGYAFYDKKDDIMRVIDKPILYIYKEKANIYSDLLKSHRKEKMTVFIGDVEIIQENKKIYGEKAIFNEELKHIVITGDPFLIERQNITHSEQITVLTDKKEVRLSKRFRGVLIPEDDISGRASADRTTEQPGRDRDRDPNDSIPIGDIGGSEIL